MVPTVLGPGSGGISRVLRCRRLAAATDPAETRTDRIAQYEVDLHIAPVLLGDGIRLFDKPGGGPIRLDLVNGSDPAAVVNVRYHPMAAGQQMTDRLRLSPPAEAEEQQGRRGEAERHIEVNSH